MQTKTIAYLKYGDRFYYAKDRKKEVWQVTSTDIQIARIKGFNIRVRAVSKIVINKIIGAKLSRMDTNVIYLRNVLEDMRPDAALFIQK